MKINKALLILCCILSMHSAMAAVENTVTSNTSITSDTMIKDAKVWNLSVDDYQRYLTLMQQSPNGHWYKTLDPIEVLGMNAQNPDEMMKYARLQAQITHNRVTQELAFDKAYRAAFKELYPNEMPIMSEFAKQETASQSLTKGDRLWLFTGLKTPLGSFVYQNLLSVIKQHPGTMLDIYFVGDDVNERSINTWAKRINIDPSLVDRFITLNVGTERFNQVQKDKNVSLPYVGIVHSGQFQPVILSSILNIR